MSSFELSSVYPFESHFVEVDGFKMHYVDEGAGEVVVLLHGNPTWSFYYRNLITKLKTNFRVIAPDFIGCGLSDHPVGMHFRAADRIRQLESFLAQLDLKNFSLVMHDWGGPLGTAVALKHLSSVNRIIYLNTTLTEIESLPYIIRKAARPFIGKFITQTTQRFLRLATEFGVVNRLSPEVKKGYLYPYRKAALRSAIWDFVADIPFEVDHPSYPALLEIGENLSRLSNIPVKIIWGLRDPCFHQEMLGRVSAHFPHAEVLELPKASHLVLEDEPEVAGNAIKDFLMAPKEELMKAPSAHSAGVQSALYDAFYRNVQNRRSAEAIITAEYWTRRPRYSYTSFHELSVLVNKYQRGLVELGLLRGDKVLFLVPPGVDFLALSLAVMARGAIPVFVDPGVGKERLKKCIEACQPDAFIGVPQALILRWLWKKTFTKCRFVLGVTSFSLGRKATTAFLKKFSAKPLSPVQSPGTSFIAFTSGATGTPKGVVYTDEMLREQLRILSTHLGMEAGGRDIPLLPIFSLFNIGLGVTTVFAPMDSRHPLALEPWKIVQTINDLKIDYSFGSPTLWTKLAEYCSRAPVSLNSIKRIFIAGAPVTDATIKKVRSIIPNGEVYVPYGATEALPVSVVTGSERLAQPEIPNATSGDQGIPVGRPLEGTELKVIQSVSTPLKNIKDIVELPPLEIGEFIVTGTQVNRNYLNNADADANSKIRDGERIWHRIGDVGYRDAQGNFYFCGRKVHSVSTVERTFYSIPMEMIFNRLETVKRSALIPLSSGNEIGIVVEPVPQYFPKDQQEKETFIAQLRKAADQSPLTKSVKKFYFHHSFPVDARHNAKIFRDQLAEWAANEK